MHAASLGPDGLVELANDCVVGARDLAAELDAVKGVQAPVHDRHHFREFVAHTDQPAAAVSTDLEAEGFAVTPVGEHLVQVCTTETNEHRRGALVAAMEDVA